MDTFNKNEGYFGMIWKGIWCHLDQKKAAIVVSPELSGWDPCQVCGKAKLKYIHESEQEFKR